MSGFDELGELVGRLGAARLELTLEFRREADGTKTGRILVRDEAGAVLADLPQASAEAMTAALARLVVLGFSEVVVQDVPPHTSSAGERRPARVSPEVLVAGVDGYRRGWVAVSLDPSGDVDVSTHSSFVEVVALRASVIAVDIPIDPPGLGARAADAAARAYVGGGRANTVFTTPPRAALEARSFAEANELARGITGKGISQQAYALARKILEVHRLAEADERVIEIHPEVSFRELAGAPLAHSKHSAEGLARRRELLREAGIELPAAYPGVPEVDLLDAGAGAWTAARYASGQARPLPEGHRARLGAIWT